ncbi:mannosylglycerate hydrolase [Spiroplasma chinense]|uniref:Mannosylglycerate hydrolase n=1 Tax=Spiroplasma chinense TaxID=216932 RepID=A0A5B9Y5C0_9MOLU|nr:glycoside hydrolase family 38 C-terminal domain-containing protein [Spiroplasma chinense]QEH61993.1 mannosylglycerate hydrolase [Spiroplasma chinense]
MQKKWKIYLVPHTHWDKEWYFTKSTSNVFLVNNINKIYDYFKKNGSSMYKYVFDSQFSIVDDYREIYKDGESKIKEMVAADKLVVSPWYTQTDTFNVTGESIVRNMLTGVKESQKYGNHMKIAYMPDSFGFNANLPQIFNSFDMKGFIHWRGVKGEQIKDGVLNNWEGIDGSKILEYNLYKFGYTCGGNFLYDLFHDGYDKDDIKNNAKKLYHEMMNDNREILNHLKSVSLNTNGKILFPFGSDQMTFFENLVEIIDEVNKLDSENEWIITSYEEYIDLLKNEINVEDLKVLSSELRYGQFSRVHKTINSGRWDIKKGIKHLEYLIYDVVEPLNLAYAKLGGTYHKELIDKSLRYLFECQAHDSAGGCNTDDTNDTVVTRLNMGIDMMETLVTLLQRQIANVKNLQTNEFIIFNPKIEENKKELKMKVFSETQNFYLEDVNGQKIDFKLCDQVKIDAEKFEKKCDAQYQDSSKEKKVFWSDIIIPEFKMKPTSITKIKLVETNEKINYVVDERNTLENDLWKISFENNQFNLFDKKNNQNIENAFSIESDYDAGDSYDFSPKAYDQKATNVLKNAICKIENSNGFETLKVIYDYEVPNGLEGNEKITQKVEFKVWLSKDFIDFNFKLINKAKDIRWRFVLDTKLESTFANSDTAFGVIKRDYDYDFELKTWKEDEWNDYPTDIESVESVVWLENKNLKTGVFVNGCNEYQIIGTKREKIAITLFRAYSLIGRKDLLFRPGRASGIEQYPHDTPKANLIDKEILIDLRVAYNSEKNLVKEAKEWCTPSTYYQNQVLNKFFAKGQMFVLPTEKISSFNYGETLISDIPEINKDLVVSCFKKQYDGDKKIIRVYNPTTKVIDIKNLSNFNHLNLKEEVIEKRETINPNEFVTIEI